MITRGINFAKRVYWYGHGRVHHLRNRADYWFFTLTEGGRLHNLELRNLKNIHAGQRCFIIGTGPSLKKHDLTKLSSEIKIGVNMILLHQDLEKIHLNYLCASDPAHWQVDGGFPRSWNQAFKKLSYCSFFFERSCFPVYKRTPELQDRKVYFINLNHSRRVFDGDFSFDIPNHTCWGRTVIIDFCLPLAFYFGFKEVFLLGCDCDYGTGKFPDYSKSYFYDTGLDNRRLPAFNTNEWVDDVISSYEVVKKVFEAHGRKIYNAGFGGKLEVFERVDYDDLF